MLGSSRRRNDVSATRRPRHEIDGVNVTARITNARFAHTNIVAADWHRLADFYVSVFGCEYIPPERNLSGNDFERGVGVPDARLRGIHVRLPGYGSDGPTLEIFQYDPLPERPATAVNRPGLAHIAFAVDDLEHAREAVIAAGGRAVGDIVTTPVGDGRSVSWCYLTDPEGNIIELQVRISSGN